MVRVKLVDIDILVLDKDYKQKSQTYSHRGEAVLVQDYKSV
jgi:hypothetical protein